LTRAYHMIGDHEQEIKAAIKAEKQYPNSWTPLRLKIKSLAAIGNLNGVNKVIDESDSKILSDYWNPARLMGVAGIEFKAHGYDAEATEMFKQLLSWLTGRSKEISESSRMKNQLGWAYYLNGNLTEAESVFRDLHESDLENLSSLGSLGFVLAWKGDKEEALQLSGQLENWDRPYLFGDDFYWQAVIFAALGEKEKAVSLLRTAVSQGLYFPDLYCNIALETLWDHPAFIELIKPRD
jgi:tetratricopeptide (TPR) repeat protein